MREVFSVHRDKWSEGSWEIDDLVRQRFVMVGIGRKDCSERKERKRFWYPWKRMLWYTICSLCSIPILPSIIDSMRGGERLGRLREFPVDHYWRFASSGREDVGERWSSPADTWSLFWRGEGEISVSRKNFFCFLCYLEVVITIISS